MHPTDERPRWTAPRLIEFARARQAENGSSYSSVENINYSPSGPT